MMRRLIFLCCALIALAACQSDPPLATESAALPFFPTMTAGQVIRRDLPPAIAQNSGSNPATALALANQATATPNFAACPSRSEVTLTGTAPQTADALSESIAQYLSAGGSPEGMLTGLRDRWGFINSGEFGGFIDSGLDLTGEGAPDLVVSLIAPQTGGTLMIFSCLDGRYVNRYQTGGQGTPPQLLTTDDLNLSGSPDLLFTSRVCDDDDVCQFNTQMASWDDTRNRFVNLLGSGVISANLPETQDVDGDSITEVVVRFDDDGSAATGPLRTGYQVYDWDGFTYAESFAQYDPPRFRIQAIHEADDAFRRGDFSDAIGLFAQAIDSPTLENWQNNDSEILPAYALYRLLLAHAYTEDPRLAETQARMLSTYPDLLTAPVYAELALRFWETLQGTGNLHSACLTTQAIINSRPEAVTLLNRYGSNSPTYSASELCPF
jgi:hypothetical protein